MAIRTVTRTGATTQFSGPTTSQDLLTQAPISTLNTQTSGAIDSVGNVLYPANNPIAITYVEINSLNLNNAAGTLPSAGSIIVEFGPNNNGTLGTAPTRGANGVSTFDLSTDTIISEIFFEPWVTGTDIYYGLYGAGSTTINYTRSTGGAYPNSSIYKDGTALYTSEAITSVIEWASVPSAPTNLTATANGTSITLDWNYPTDDGFSTAGNGTYIFNNRILYRSLSDGVIQSTGLIGDVFSYTFDGLNSNDTYEFWVAAINDVCDIHNGFGSIYGLTPNATYTDLGATTGTNAYATADTTGGIVRVFSGSTPVVGIAHVKQNGSWVPAVAVYGNSGGSWLPSQ